MRTERGSSNTPALAVLVVLAGVVVITLLGDRSGDPEEQADLSTLKAVSTNTTFSAAPPDAEPFGATDGLVVHPRAETALYSEPGSGAFAKIGPRQFGPTWLPVVEQEDGWVRVLLPSRPNRSTGWLREDGLQRAQSPYVVRVHTASRVLELIRGGERQGRWQVAVGARKTPTPAGRTFVLGSITDRHQSYSPVILPLGAHSPTLDTFGGGPGTVALHGWPSASVFGEAVSHGCIRVPDKALDQLRQVPLGTVVVVDNR